MSRRKGKVALLDESVEFLLGELRLMAAAWKADPEYDGTVTLNAADAHAILYAYDRAVGGTRKRIGQDSGKAQPTAKVKVRRIAVLKRELHLKPGQRLDAATLQTARAVLTRHKLRQDNDTRLREEIRTAMT